MIDKVLSVGGKPKKLPDCKVCDNGKKWNDHDYTYEDSLAPRVRQMICPECLTKYVYRAKLKTDETITEKKVSSVARLLMKDLEDSEVEKLMTDNRLVTLKEEYGQTGVCNCPAEFQTRTHPFKTLEGSFSLDTCLVCREASIEYHGKKYKDDIFVIVDFLVREGRKNEKIPSISFLGATESAPVQAYADKQKINFEGFKKESPTNNENFLKELSFIGSKQDEIVF